MPNPPVGPERDRVVAEVLGWCYPRGGVSIVVGDAADVWEDGSRKWYHTDDASRPIRLLPTPPFSTSPAAAFEALEMWRGQDEGRVYAIYSPGTDSGFVVAVSTGPDHSHSEDAPTFPDAATAALLRAGT